MLKKAIAFAALLVATTLTANAADHNDPNPINSIFSDVPINPGDLYDFFGFPSADTTNGESVVVALTFAPAPSAGEFDPDFLYRILIDPDRRATRPTKDPMTWDVEDLLSYAKAVDDKFLRLKAAEIRITSASKGEAKVQFIGFPGGDFSKTIPMNQSTELESGDHKIKAYVGARDDAFFNDLPGFFRSINYAPQFYKVPYTMPKEMREIATPKTLLELEGNTFFNFDPANPDVGYTRKLDLPEGDMAVKPTAYKKDVNGNFRFVYSGKDAQAGINVNALIFELPMAYLTDKPSEERVVNAWGESWVRKASSKIEEIPDDPPKNRWPWLVPIALGVLGILFVLGPSKSRGVGLLVAAVVAAMLVNFLFAGPQSNLDAELDQFKIVDTDGVPFEDAALAERLHSANLGANNLKLARGFVTRTAHLGWGFGPSIDALGIKGSFDHGNSLVPVHKTYKLATAAFPRVKKVLFQELNMPDESWNPKGMDIRLKRGVEIFVPNVCAIDMDTTGTWPFGRRLEDQVATRFLSIFLDMSQTINGQPVHVDTLGDQALWDSAPIEPKTPPNPLHNDKDFLSEFPYLAEPW